MFVPVLYSYTVGLYLILKITNKRMVFYEFIMGNIHEVLGFKAKYGGLWANSSAARGNRGSPPPVFGDFCNFLIKSRILRHILA